MTADMKEFQNLINEDEQRAKALFFSESFKETYLSHDDAKKKMYHQLLLGRNREQIFEEFLIATKLKESVKLTAEVRMISNQDQRECMCVTLHKTPGYIEGTIVLESTDLSIEEHTFSVEDFVDDRMEIPIYEREVIPGKKVGVLSILTPYQELRKNLVYDNHSMGLHAKQEKKEDALNAYIQFCNGNISLEHFIAKEKSILNNYGFEEQEECLNLLLSLHIMILEKSPESQIEKAFYLVEKTEESRLKEPLNQCYYLYLKALFLKQKPVIERAVEYIRGYSSDLDCESGMPLWMLIYLDSDLAYNTEKQMEKIKEADRLGLLNPLLSFEVCSIWNRDESQLKEFDDFTCRLAMFGIKHDALCEEVFLKLNDLAKKSKVFTKDRLLLLLHMYEAKPKDYILQTICSYLIRGNDMSPCYHHYFEKALEAKVQVVGLQEAYIRTMEPFKYPRIHQKVLLYFTYSNSLNDAEQAYLYVNILKNPSKYADVIDTYEAKIRQFVLAKVRAGAMSNHLIFLYQFYFQEIMESQIGKDFFGQLIYRKKLTWKSSYMEKVMILEDYRKVKVIEALHSSEIYPCIMTQKPELIFQDQKGNSYVSVPYQLSPIWTKEQVETFEASCNKEDQYFLKKRSLEISEKDQIEESDIPLIYRILDMTDLKESYLTSILEKLIQHYWKHGKKDQLKDCLRSLDLTYLSPDHYVHILELLIENQLYENALEGIHSYGFQKIKPEILLQFVTWFLKECKGEKIDILVDMCGYVFEHNQVNVDILLYLQKYFKGTIKQQLHIWKCGKTYDIYQKEFVEEAILYGIEHEVDEQQEELFMDYVGHDGFADEVVKAGLKAYVRYAYQARIQYQEDFYQLLREYLPIFQDDLIAHWVYFDYYRNRTCTPKEDACIKGLIEKELEHDCLLPIVFMLKEPQKLPLEVYSYTYIVYEDKPDKLYTFHGVGYVEDQYFEQLLTELLPGYYVGKAVIFCDDLKDYYITTPGETQRRRKDIQMLNPEHIEKTGRFYLLNEILKHKHQEDVLSFMEEYALEKGMIATLEP